MQIAIKLQGGQWVNEACLCVTKLQLYWEEYLVTDFRQQGNKAAKLFKEIDTDGSGYITAAEFKRVLLKQIDRVVDEIHKMDKNGDGKISLKGKQEVGLNNLLGVACEEGNFEKQKGQYTSAFEILYLMEGAEAYFLALPCPVTYSSNTDRQLPYSQALLETVGSGLDKYAMLKTVKLYAVYMKSMPECPTHVTTM